MGSKKTLTFFLMVMLTTWNVAAQQITGSIRGTVSDPSGAIVQTATAGLDRARDRAFYGGKERQLLRSYASPSAEIPIIRPAAAA